MPEQIKLIQVEALWRRLALVLAAAGLLLSAWYVARWGVGGTLAEYPPDESAVRAAARLAPDDPQVHYTLGVYARRSFEPAELNEAVQRYTEATSLSPNDYRLWMDLGRVRGQAGDAKGGELALRRAVELAPNYALPRWYLGNLLLRDGRQPEAFAELRRAAELNPELLPQVFTLAWSFFGGDAEAAARTVGQSATARAKLSEFLVKQKQLDDALRLWSSLSAAEKRSERASGEALGRALYDGGRIQTALGVYRDLSPEASAGVGEIADGGFESDRLAGSSNPFGWDLKPLPQAQISFDTRNPHGGKRSLRLMFTVRTTLAFSNVSQTVAVAPHTRYRLTFFIRTDDLKSASTLVAEVVSGTSVLATSTPAPGGTNDWQQVTLEFTTPAQAEAVSVRLSRPPCTEDVCPIFGKIWYDDFSLQSLG